MIPPGIASGRFSPRDGRLGPRGLRRGPITVEQQRARDELIARAREACDGNDSRALGVLAGCAYELAFRIADTEGPPPPERLAMGSWRDALGDIVFQPTSRILQKVATYFGVEAKNFLKWKGEHVETVRDRMGEAAHQFGEDLGAEVLATEARKPEQQGQPMTREEFSEVLFERRVHEVYGRAVRAQPYGHQGAVRLLSFALADALNAFADENLHEAAATAFELGKHLDKLAKRLQVGGYRARAHWADDEQEATRLTAIADKLEREYSAQR